MKKIIFVLLAGIMSVTAYASLMRNFTTQELKVMNRLLECTDEVATVMKKAEWVGSGGCVTNDFGDEYCQYKFARREGFTGAKRVATVTVVHEKLKNPPMDHPGYSVRCAITDNE